MPSSSKSKIYFFFETPVSLRGRTALKELIESIFRSEKKQLSRINYVFCSDKRLLEINRQFLRHDYYTDIVTFPLHETGMPIEAEIYISIDRVKENATLFAKSFANELHRVIIHGTLHLCGYSDKTKGQKEKMRSKEDQYLKRLAKS